MVAEKLVSAWEETYREYMDGARTDVADTSVAVATAWRALAENVELPWWLFAAVNSAAEAFEHQGEVCGANRAPNGVAAASFRRGGCERRDEDNDQDQEPERAFVVPTLPNARTPAADLWRSRTPWPGRDADVAPARM